MWSQEGLNFELRSVADSGVSHPTAMPWATWRELGGSSAVLSTRGHLAILALRGILTCKLGIGYWRGGGEHNPKLPYSLSLRLGQGFALSLGPRLVDLQSHAVASSLLQGLMDLVRVFNRSCKLPSGFAQHTSPQRCFAARGGTASGKWPRMEKLTRKGALWLDGVPRVAGWAGGSWPVYARSYHQSSSWHGVLGRGGGHGAGQCDGAGESRAARVNRVICARCFERMKGYKMPINIMRYLTALFNVPVLFSLVCISKRLLAKGTVIVSIQKGKF